MCTITHGFLKKARGKRHLNIKNVDLHSSFSEKMDLYQKNVNLYAWYSEKKWTSTCKCGPFTHDFLKYVDGYACAIFCKKWTSTWKMLTLTRHFLK